MGFPADRFGFPDFSGKTILVIDDHADSLDFLTEMLSFCGANVLPAQSTAHARMRLRTSRTPDLIICDFQMQRETGVEFIRWLRQQAAELASIPAIAVTGYPSDFLKQRDALKLFDGYFSKPLDSPRFLGILEAVLFKRRPRSDLIKQA